MTGDADEGGRGGKTIIVTTEMVAGLLLFFLLLSAAVMRPAPAKTSRRWELIAIRFGGSEAVEAMLGDLEEQFERDSANEGARHARSRYIRNVLSLLLASLQGLRGHGVTGT